MLVRTFPAGRHQVYKGIGWCVSGLCGAVAKENVDETVGKLLQQVQGDLESPSSGALAWSISPSLFLLSPRSPRSPSLCLTTTVALPCVLVQR